MVATVRCEEIANEKFSSFSGNQVMVATVLAFSYFSIGFTFSVKKRIYLVSKLGEG